MSILSGKELGQLFLRGIRYDGIYFSSFLRIQKFHGNSTTALFTSADVVSSSTGMGKTDNATGKPNAPTPRRKTPIGKLDELEEGKHPFQEKEPLPPFPDNTNPLTGEVGGPRGPEPTRYGDWERKGRVSDF